MPDWKMWVVAVLLASLYDVGTISQTLWPMHSISDEQCVCVVYIKEIQNINFDKGEIA